VRALLDLLLPPSCPGCGLEGVILCETCATRLMRRMDEPPGVPLGLVVPHPPGIVQLEWCGTFSGPVRAAIHALKYRGERRLASALGEALAQRWRRAGRGGDLLVPVPVHAHRRRERGFDQAEDLARVCGRSLGLPVLTALERRQRTIAQHALGQEQRLRNVGHAFGVRAGLEPAVAGRWPILVDDVTTTGATLSGCAVAMLEAGAVAVSALTVARDR
jgi:ComF family protein